MSTKAIRLGLACAALGWGAAATACGFCIEDRVAAAYDQAMVDHARAGNQSVAFFSIDGTESLDEKARLAVIAALEKAGAARGSVKVAHAQVACALAYDPLGVGIAAVAAKASRELAARGISLKPLRIIDADGRLREPA
jgi:hypothetical protein